jgi:hypothetical protein
VRRAREIGTVLAAAATLLGAVAEFSRSRKDAVDTYQNVALTAGDTAGEVEAIKVRLADVEKACGVTP